MRRDPHAGKTPGQGCGCALCGPPGPLPPAPDANPIEGQARRDLYESGRRVYRVDHDIPARTCRGPGASTEAI